ncbi:DUF58 domain-containing protein [Halosimplex salinum]|uniref:DUF58 domain-containing protein n=1 Tax=Halosimplex salinum TaxID=1710538 RepID=UPI000F49863C|nr:DUF58 domain-containing protein [Halosimplex salinum]
MQLTRRGYAVVGIVLVAEVFAITYGARALNAVAAPALVALLASVVQLWRSEPPAAERDTVPAGFPGDTREVTVEVSGSGVALIEETVPDGLAAEGATVEATLPTTVSYSLTCVERGRHKLGPLDVRVRDILGLVETTYSAGSTTRVVVYPPVYQVAGRDVIVRHVLDRSEVERQEFDSLREYVPGDPLRDVHWKSTAKAQDEIFVTEFADNRVEDDDLVVAATADAGAVDEMAAAAASVVVMALDAGLSVELRIPEQTVPLGRGEEHRRRLLGALAVTNTDFTSPFKSYALPDGAVEDADVVIRGSSDGVTVTFGTDDRTFEEITVSRENPLTNRGVES